MLIKAITNLREFILDTEDIKLQSRNGTGMSLFTIAKKQLRKGENLVKLVDITELT